MTTCYAFISFIILHKLVQSYNGGWVCVYKHFPKYTMQNKKHSYDTQMHNMDRKDTQNQLTANHQYTKFQLTANHQ